MNTKGQGLSMNVIIIAAIALIVLVVLVVLVLRAGGDVNEAKQCKSLGGNCDISCTGNAIPTNNPGCTEPQRCCLPIGG